MRRGTMHGATRVAGAVLATLLLAGCSIANYTFAGTYSNADALKAGKGPAAAAASKNGTAAVPGLNTLASSLDQLLQITIDFTADGKATVQIAGQKAQGTYRLSGKEVQVTIDGSTESFTVDGKGCLVLDSEIPPLCKVKK